MTLETITTGEGECCCSLIYYNIIRILIAFSANKLFDIPKELCFLKPNAFT